MKDVNVIEIMRNDKARAIEEVKKAIDVLLNAEYDIVIRFDGLTYSIEYDFNDDELKTHLPIWEEVQ